MAPLADQQARERIEHDLDTTFVVEAAAGTGKTTALVGRIIALVRTGVTRLARIVAVTFTEKAAGEMKLRLREAIEEARRDAPPEERGRLDRALSELEEARIGTIHSLCADLLRERPVEAGIDPRFEVAPAEEADRLFEQAFDGWFQRVLADPPPGVRRLLRRAPSRDGHGPRDRLRDAGRRLREHRDFRAPWRRDPDFDRDAALDAMVERIAEVADLYPLADVPDSWLGKQIGKLHRWVDELRSREAVAGRDHDGLEAELRELLSWRTKWQWKGHPYRPFSRERGLSPDQVRAKRDALHADLQALVDRCEADLAALLHDELWPLVDRYEALKHKAGRLDFLDLLQCTRDLLAGNDAVRHELQQRFSHLLVDEFQDNDPLQTEIVLLLASADPAERDPSAVQVVPGKLFLVGDPKQSIYRFRRADVAIYHAVKQRLVEQGAEVLHLSTSFRGDPRIQQAVNACFAPRMTGGGQAEYVPLQPYREPTVDRPAVVALPVPKPYSQYGRITKWAVRESTPEAVGAWVRWLVHDSGWRVTEPGTTERVPVQPRHVCLLFRRFRSWGESITQPYTRALESRGVPHVLVGGRSYHDREEVLAVRNALTAIEWPDDELRVFATLRGPLFAVGDDALLAWRHRFGRLHPLRVDRADGRPRGLGDDEALTPLLAEVSEPLRLLGTLHRGRNRRPVADTLVRLLDATRAHAGLALWSGGEQVLANVLRVAQHARRFEAAGATSFRAFVEHLEAEAERGETGEAPVVEEGTEGVRLMTVHKAKGLEFPVVVLCDPTCNPVSKRPSRYVDSSDNLWAEPLAGCVPLELSDHADDVLREDRHESDRLLYVAATRARDVLVVPAVGDEPLEDAWVEPLYPALYPTAAGRTKPEPAPGCPAFGDDTAVERPRDDAQVEPVQPGRHQPLAGDHPVTWWDPAVLDLDVPPSTGLRSMGLLVEDDAGTWQQGEHSHAQWVRDRAARVVEGAAPTVRIHTPTELGEAAEGGGEAIAVHDTGLDREGRPHGKRFGTLVHGVLAEVPLDASDADIEAAARLQARLVGAGRAEIEAAVAATRAALRHDLIRRAAASPDCRREVPLSAVASDGSRVEGTADLAFREGEGWVVVDFKTDLEIEPLRKVYAVQVGWYARAIEQATGQPAEGVLLRV